MPEQYSNSNKPEDARTSSHKPHGRGPMGGPMGHGMRGGGEKAKNFNRAISQLAAYCKAYLPLLITAGVFSVAGTILNIIGPDKLSEITNLIAGGLMTGIDIDAVVKVAIFLTILYGLGFVFNLAQGLIMATVTQQISKSMRSDISVKINRLPLSYFDKVTTGDVLSRVTNDVDTIGQSLNQSIVTLVSAIVMFLGSLFMMFYTNWIMALSGIAATLFGFIFMTLIISHSQKYFRQQQQELGALNGHIEETYAGHNVVKAYNAERKARKSFSDMNSKLYQCAWKSQFMSGLMPPLMSFVGNFGYVVICVVGAVLVSNGSIEFGTIVAFMLYIRLFSQPLTQMAQAATSLQSAAAASERVFEFLGEIELSDETDKKLTLASAEGAVEFKNVKFGYHDDRMIIHNFSATVKPGQKIAIVGPTGAGKTTLVNLLMRFYELNGGQIMIDGTPADQLTRENIHDLFGMVLQDTWLFEGTIRENIVYNKQGVTDQQVEAACRAAGLHHYIKTLPKGYDTLLNDNATLSAGQRQLVTIARAMIENAPMLILDEATSSVDTRTELLIQKAMDTLTKGRTSFVIAHRLSTIRNADLILVMKDGDIIESGKHEELLAKGGFYADLYNSQFEVA